jgi:hypothetical protein
MMLRLALLGRVAYTPALQGIKRIHGSNRTGFYLQERTRDLVERVAAIDSFFSREGRSMPWAGRLHRLGRRSIAERAYWCGMKDLARGRRSALALFGLAIKLDRTTALLPPVSYLFRMKRRNRQPIRISETAAHPVPSLPGHLPHSAD